MLATALTALMLTTASAAAPAWSKKALDAAKQKVKVTKDASALREAAPQLPRATASDGHKLYVFNTSTLIGAGEFTELLEVDIGAGTIARAATGISPENSFVSSSAICNGRLYAVGTYAPMDAGILAINLTSGANTYLSTLIDGYLVHALACGNSPRELKMVVSEFTSPPTFTLRTYDLENSTSTIVGTFDNVLWGGWDSIFSFRGGDVWGSFPLWRPHEDPTNCETGELLIMDATTGAIKSRKSYPAHGGEPYYTLPPKPDGTFNAVFHKGVGNLDFCACNPSGTSISCSGCTDASEWWDAGEPVAECADGSVHVASRATQTADNQPISFSDGTTAQLTHVFDLANPAKEYTIQEMNCFA